MNVKRNHTTATIMPNVKIPKDLINASVKKVMKVMVEYVKVSEIQNTITILYIRC